MAKVLYEAPCLEPRVFLVCVHAVMRKVLRQSINSALFWGVALLAVVFAPAAAIAQGQAGAEGVATEVTSHGVTLTLNRPVEFGYSLDGVAYIFTPPEGLEILSRTDPSTMDEGVRVNGTMKNPQRRGVHGYDGRTDTYREELDEPFPIRVVAGDIVVCAVHRPGAGQNNPRAGVVLRYAGFVFVAELPPVNTLAPALSGWEGRGTPQYYPIDLPAAVAELPSYSLEGIAAPSFEQLMTQFDRIEVGWGATQVTGARGGYERLTSYNQQSRNYGVGMASWVGAALLMLLSDGLDAEQKAALLMRMISYGIQAWDPIAGRGEQLKADGGHNQFQFGPMLAALKWTGRSHLLDSFKAKAGGNVLLQPFFHTEETLNALQPHDDMTRWGPMNGSHIARRRTVLSVSDDTVELPTDTGPHLDPYHVRFNGLQLVRERDGATAIVEGSRHTSGRRPVFLHLDKHPDPRFAVGDVVYLRSQDPIEIGDPDWRIVETLASINPGFYAAYRDLNFWSDALLFAHAIGMWHPDFDAMQAYVLRANRPDDPAPGRAYRSHLRTLIGTDLNFSRDFWAAHASEIIPAMTQD